MKKKPITDEWDQRQQIIRNQWPHLTEQDFVEINGDHRRLVDRLQSRYGWSNSEAEAELKNFIHRRLTLDSPLSRR
jgi:hypothetical protein